jgi:hypothetical protein
MRELTASLFYRPEVQSLGVCRSHDSMEGPWGRSFITSPDFWWPQASLGCGCISIISTSISSWPSLLCHASVCVPPKDIIIRVRTRHSSPGWPHLWIPAVTTNSVYPNKTTLLSIRSRGGVHPFYPSGSHLPSFVESDCGSNLTTVEYISGSWLHLRCSC